jgi:glycosyltransferase involved in cell wall biosynthesis
MKEKNKIGLCMIVKNESAIIERCLSSLVNIIDEYLIVDTGSTDTTIEKIRQFFANYPQITGQVLTHEWKNFGHNRTLLFQEARVKLNVDWFFTIDADMVLENLGFVPQNLNAQIGAYQIIQNNGFLSYANLRLLNAKYSWQSIGVTHEFLDSENSQSELLKTLRIHDIGDGGAKADKFERDIYLLEQGLLEEPNNSRYMFYLANSYKDIRNYSSAIEWYKKRIKRGGWIEEITCSYEYLGICYESLGETELAIQTWLRGFEYNPKRAESLYRACKNLRERGEYNLAYMYAKTAKAIKYPVNDVLFINREIYEYLIDQELSIITYYVNPTEDIRGIFANLLRKNVNYENIIANYKFYAKSLYEIEHYNMDLDDLGILPGYHNSSPAIIQKPNGYTINLRRVSYSIDEQTGAYLDLATGENCSIVNTINTRVELDKNFQVESIENFITPDLNEKHVNGIEDLKLIGYQNQVLFIGNKWINKLQIQQVIGEYTANGILPETIISSPEQRIYEKNWVPFVQNEKLYYVYDWSPITIGTIDGTKFKTHKILNKSLPHYRGSSPGFAYGKYLFFLVHNVEYSTPRNYYHSIVILDINTLEFVKASKLFTFDGNGIEFGLGLIIENNRVIITHSRWDKKAYLRVYDFYKFMNFIFD